MTPWGYTPWEKQKPRKKKLGNKVTISGVATLEAMAWTPSERAAKAKAERTTANATHVEATATTCGIAQRLRPLEHRNVTGAVAKATTKLNAQPQTPS